MSATRAATRMTLAYNPTHNWEESLTMILPASLRSANIDALATVELDNGGLDDMPATVLDRDKLLEHLGRDALHVLSLGIFPMPISEIRKIESGHGCS